MPPLLVVQVGALPMGALVEAQLEACTPSSVPPLYRDTWSMPLTACAEGEAAATGEMWCDATVAAAAAALPTEAEGSAQPTPQVASGVVNCVISASGSPLTCAQVGTSIAAVLAQLEERLRSDTQHGGDERGGGDEHGGDEHGGDEHGGDRHGGGGRRVLVLGHGIYLRLLCDESCLPEGGAAAVSDAVSRGVCAAGPWDCAAFALPVTRVIGSAGRQSARIAAQLHFTASVAGRADV